MVEQKKKKKGKMRCLNFVYKNVVLVSNATTTTTTTTVGARMVTSFVNSQHFVISKFPKLCKCVTSVTHLKFIKRLQRLNAKLFLLWYYPIIYLIHVQTRHSSPALKPGKYKVLSSVLLCLSSLFYTSSTTTTTTTTTIITTTTTTTTTITITTTTTTTTTTITTIPDS